MKDESAQRPSFEDSLAELERILRDLEDGTTSLEDSLARYERGVSLLKHCYGQLRDAEQRIARLTGEDAEGNPVTEEFGHSASLEQNRASRRDGLAESGDTIPF